jgi:hypothetical protein
LPKFDGKDFYPPSPVKQEARLAPVTPSNNTRAAGLQMHFEKLFDSPAASPQQITDRMSQFNQTSIPNQPACFGSPEHGHGSFSFRSSANVGPTDDLAQQPQTPLRHHVSTQSLAMAPIAEDFSRLFLEPGVPGYKTPSPLPKSTGLSAKEPVTPRNPGSPGNKESENEYENVNTIEARDNDASSTNSTVEFHLSPQDKTYSPRTSHKVAFTERVENFRT